MSGLLFAGVILYLISRKLDPIKNKSKIPKSNEITDNYTRDDTYQGANLYPEDHKKSDHLLKAISGPTDWFHGPTKDQVNVQLAYYQDVPKDAPSYRADDQISAKMVTWNVKDDEALISMWKR